MVDVRLDESGRVSKLRQEVQACALGQAAAALMGQSAIGRTHDDLCLTRDALAAFLRGDGDLPSGWPGLERLAVAQAYPGRHAAILLPFQAVADAAAGGSARAAAA